MTRLTFPRDFIWGTATASYQIEGARDEDGRTASIWDTFARQPGKVHERQNGAVACDHYHRYPEDIRLMRELGVQSYRFSIAWPRIFPEAGKFNPKGLDFYKRLVDELKANDITPAATVYHWDLPQYLQDKGGWVNRDIVKYYVEYATKLFEELGNDIPSWITHNEPWCAAFLSYGMGHHAPGHQDWREAVRAAHHILLSHGEAVKVFRQVVKPTQKIGITLNLEPSYPATDAPDDKAAAVRQDGFYNRWFLDAVFKGAYPEDMVQVFEPVTGPLDFILPGDMQTIATPTDFLGINFYTRSVVKDGTSNPVLHIDHVRGEGRVTDMGWEVYPNALYDLLTRLKDDYTTLPLFITENGAAYPDVLVDGRVNDQDRIAYLWEHFAAAHRFIQEGGNLQGYYVWSFMDNYEWAFGYSKRFGIVYVDYETQKRTLKESAKWFRRVIAENSLV